MTLQTHASRTQWQRPRLRQQGWLLDVRVLAVLLFGVLVGGSACSPRYSIHQLEGSGFTVDGDAWVAPDSTLLVSYDFWANGGQPFMALLNPQPDTVYIDLNASTITTAPFGRVSLGEALGGGPRATRRDIIDNYPELALQGLGRELELVLLPEVWVSFYGIEAALVDEMTWLPAERDDELEQVIVEFIWRCSEREEVTRHELQVRTVERVRAKEYRRYGSSMARPNRYFVDRGPRRRRLALQMAVEVGSAVLIAF